MKWFASLKFSGITVAQDLLKVAFSVILEVQIRQVKWNNYIGMNIATILVNVDVMQCFYQISSPKKVHAFWRSDYEYKTLKAA